MPNSRTRKGLRIVVTGAPNSGKSTTINKLRERGFHVLEEQAREIISEGVLSPVKDLDVFNQEVYIRQTAEEAACVSDIAFMDRGRYDAFAYYEALGKPLPKFLIDMQPGLYDLAFVQDVVPAWDADGVRSESLEFAERIDPLFASAYARMRVNTIRVPLMKPEERVIFILDKIKGLYPDLKLERYKADGRLRTVSSERMIVEGITEEIEYTLALLSNIGSSVCVLGSGRAEPTSKEYQSAKKFGALLAAADIATLTSGGNGISAAVSQGCFEANGTTVVMNVAFPDEASTNGNAFAKVPIRLGTLAGRNEISRRVADAYAVYPGGFGTISEVSEVLRLIQTGCISPRPVILIGNRFWSAYERFLLNSVQSQGYILAKERKLYQIVNTADQAMSLLREHFARQAA